MSKYIRVLWKHDLPDERYPLFQGISLVDDDMPTAAEIRAMTAEESPGQFEVFESTQLEFENLFRNATPLTESEEEAE